MILDGHGYFVGHSLIHGVAVNLFAKGLVGLGNGRTRETYKSGMRKGLAQHLGVGL